MACLAPRRQLSDIDDAEIAIAREIQSAFLPTTCKGCEGVSTAARRQPSGSVGGDLHDFVVARDGRYSVIIGDVIGHGLHSALGMALVLGAIRALGPGADSPFPVMQRINDLLCRINDRMRKNLVLCSLCYGIVDPMREVLRFCNAGHPYPLVWTHNGQVLKLRATCTLLGVSPELEGESMSLPLGQVRRAIFYTDGATEARSPSGNFLGVGRVQQVLEQTSQLSVEAQADALMAEIACHVGQDLPLNDDATMIVADFSAPSVREPEDARA